MPLKTLAAFAASISLLLASPWGLASNSRPHPLPQVKFFDFTYEGKDDIFAAPLKPGEYQNPILAGFYPDPSIVRVGEDFFLATSSFSYSPGVPIFHSKDLVNWRSLGHALIDTEQLPLFNQSTSRGIYAPTLRHHKGVFYLITTLVDVRGNFLVTATNPAGPWSKPILLPEVGGIDPDIFFDDDGRVYIAHNDGPPGEPQYEGHRAIWMWEYDPDNQKIIPDSRRLLVDGGSDLKKKPIWVEGPHLYKINGWYYLVCAEGGTGYDHSAVVFRSKSLQEPFIPYGKNPILTQRDLDPKRANAINNAGHADLVQTAEGEWWAVFLATRTYQQEHFNTGRETFLLPVRWHDEWPVILDAGKAVPYRLPAPSTQAKSRAAQPTTGNFVWEDSFTRDHLAHDWLQLRIDHQPFYQLLPHQGAIALEARPVTLAQLEQPAFLARRQQHMHYTAKVSMALPRAKGIAAGLAAFQSEQAHYFLAVERNDKGYAWFVEQANLGAPQIIARGQLALPFRLQTLQLGLRLNTDTLDFYYWDSEGKKRELLSGADASILSSHKAGGFVGSMVGLHVRQSP
ncbi:glycoside hydrolase family 43 protein [Cellvibrio japonicus]|uniref:Beta-xylosidase/alpha-L-arabinfuranosidase, putative, gly43J n=1 Tax=Cellvibrio japonicus (strain Ueda107) TaxID=498211 RepID=B3PDA9_CELJU|nr:glycoside hydrolase family 43 protein [Cellvibrio japonicus]ACE85569.1 beta-xylosidase/alpha-L-arabinfuranosidase, putative, gly43J [Cellvibrio japonicus Ueda107]QEI13364.1 glycoside hydrolase family 43 protein [Cellvibrio japonicus]QEI16938.1 glycoside hydrolase family 43 protein [Cellvibrio japonicus]QEI20516.1 glycoside hydrolase family 43 protein [Cellvibrio japonicus]